MRRELVGQRVDHSRQVVREARRDQVTVDHARFVHHRRTGVLDLAMRPIPAKPSFTLIPIAPARLAEKKAIGDFFFQTILTEGVLLATEN